MNCPQCNSEMIRAQATDFGEAYDFCRTCKKELKELQPKVREYVLPAIDFAHAPQTLVPHKGWAPPQIVFPLDNINCCGPSMSMHFRTLGSERCFCGAVELNMNGDWNYRLDITPATGNKP